MSKKVDYSKNETPDDYKCGKCGATGCKLWTENDLMTKNLLLCAKCATSEQNENIDDIASDGTHDKGRGNRTDFIGSYIPAVPREDGNGYWTYIACPRAGGEWWRRLPTKI